MAELRRPGDVADDPAADPRPDVTGGLDTDGDGRPDTVVTDDGVDLVVATDLDGDGLADQVLRLGPDGAAHVEVSPFAPPGGGVLDGLWGGVDAGLGG